MRRTIFHFIEAIDIELLDSDFDFIFIYKSLGSHLTSLHQNSLLLTSLPLWPIQSHALMHLSAWKTFVAYLQESNLTIITKRGLSTKTKSLNIKYSKVRSHLVADYPLLTNARASLSTHLPTPESPIFTIHLFKLISTQSIHPRIPPQSFCCTSTKTHISRLFPKISFPAKRKASFSISRFGSSSLPIILLMKRSRSRFGFFVLLMGGFMESVYLGGYLDIVTIVCWYSLHFALHSLLTNQSINQLILDPSELFCCTSHCHFHFYFCFGESNEWW